MFSRSFQKQHKFLDPQKYVTKVFFGQHSYDDERAINERMKIVFADRTGLFLHSMDDTLELSSAGRQTVLTEMREMGQWDHDDEDEGKDEDKDGDDDGDEDKDEDEDEDEDKDEDECENSPPIIHYPYAGVDLNSDTYTPGAKEIVDVLRAIFRTVAVLNEKMYIHRDIKLDNIVWNSETNAFLLIDYGVAEFVDPGKTFPAYANWNVTYYEPPETVLNIRPEKALKIFKDLRDCDRLREPWSNPVLDRLVGQHTLSLLGATRRMGSPLERALARAGLYSCAEEALGIQVGQKRRAPSKTRQTLLAEEIAEAVKQLEPRYRQAMDVGGYPLRSLQTTREGTMADIVRAYNAYQVGQLLRSLIAKIRPDTDPSDPAPTRVLQGWAGHLMHLFMDERLRGWDAIAEQLAV